MHRKQRETSSEANVNNQPQWPEADGTGRSLATFRILNRNVGVHVSTCQNPGEDGQYYSNLTHLHAKHAALAVILEEGDMYM